MINTPKQAVVISKILRILVNNKNIFEIQKYIIILSLLATKFFYHPGHSKRHILQVRLTFNILGLTTLTMLSTYII